MSSSASALAQLIPFHLKTRTIFVKCTPAPANFYERRAILRTLQNTTSGGIETFKKLEDNSSFIAVTTKPDAAASLIQDAPLVRMLISQNEATTAGQPSNKAWGAEFDLRGSFTTPVNPLPLTQRPVETPVTRNLGLSQKTFTLHIFPANTSYNHREAIKRDPLHGRWPGDGSIETFISAALYRSLPANAMAPALRDWETGNQMSREGTTFAFEAGEGAAATLLGKKRYSVTEHFLLERIRKRWDEREIPEVMKSLAGYAAKCGVEPEPKTSPARRVRTPAPAPELKGWPSKSPAKKTGDTLLNDSTFKQLLGKSGKK
ncbi:hypothetical protein F4775DRAFT_594366 [Biscogniauxia sp. FL1348]|nr:hypothetical protein F4775DRAFT_594366 [Biscogniauxia sp. FL1348]